MHHTPQAMNVMPIPLELHRVLEIETLTTS